MAIYSTLFLCVPEALKGGFPGWQLPLPAPVRREFRNPFTGQITTIETREPDWPADEIAEPAPVLRPATTVASGDFLEARLRAFVRDRPHWATRNLTEVELKPLIAILGSPAKFEIPLYAPPASKAIVQAFPRDAAVKLASLRNDGTRLAAVLAASKLFAATDPPGVTSIANQWAAAMSTPDHTHNIHGKRIKNDWTLSDSMERLLPIVTLSQQVSDLQRMYLLTEF